MLIKFRVSNFLSFEKLTEVGMIPSNKVQGMDEHIININNTSLLKYGVIYGANAAGKSNLIKVFQFIRHCVLSNSIIDGTGMFCKNSEENKHIESIFEVQFTINGKFYA